MNISEFAEKHRLKTRRDDCGELIIPGKNGHIYEHDEDTLGVMYIGTPRKWTNRRNEGVYRDMFVWQNGDGEGSLLFKADDGEQAAHAIKVARCRQKRRLTEEQREALVARLEKARRKQAVQNVESI